MIIMVLSVMAKPINLTWAAKLGNIHGTIVDEEGNPIHEVKVFAYLNTGSLEEIEYTNEDGYFRMNLGGTYTLVFEKYGYVTFQKNVQVTQAPTEDSSKDIVKLGELEMEKTLALSASVVKRLTTPGNKLTLEFTVANRGEETEDVLFYANAPEDWEIKILDNVGEIENILLSPGSAEYYIEINIPETATTVETITITATGTSTTTLDFTITPKVYADEIELKSTYLSISEELEETISLPLTVSNVGEVDKKITLQANIPSGWTITFRTGSGIVVKTLLMEAGKTEQLTIELETPDTVSVGDYNVVVSAMDVNGALLDTLELDVNLRVGTSEIEVISSFSEVSVEAGESINFPLAVWNKGEADALTLFTVPVIPENWDVSFIADDLEIASIHIPSGESESVQLIVEPPNSVVSGTYNLKAVIESDDGTQYELDFAIEVVGSYNLYLELSTLYTTVQIGGSVTYTAKVTNEGQTAVTTLYLDAIVPDDWETTITPVQVSSLDPRDSVTFTIVADVPSNTESGDYLITMQVLSDQLDSDEIDIRITAQASNTWGYIGLGMAVVAVVGVALLFRRFKRR
jgi:uncharacterized repeat protein (TIGR01451 family)